MVISRTINGFIVLDWKQCYMTLSTMSDGTIQHSTHHFVILMVCINRVAILYRF